MNLLLENALDKFKEDMKNAETFGELKANCGFFATTGPEKQPSVRIITIHDVTDDGLLFIAKKSSGKIKQIKQNPKIGLCFFWDAINLQVTLEGIVEPLDENASSKLWNKRDHHANLSAWAIDMASTENKENDLREMKTKVRERFKESRIPLPDSWSGYMIKPSRIEFWPIGWKKNKKHICYIKRGGFWQENTFH
jgi:pyridoxamine 5'-phosphate oxidase